MNFYKITLNNLVFYDIFVDPKVEFEEMIRQQILHDQNRNNFVVLYQQKILLEWVLSPSKNYSKKNPRTTAILNEDKTISYFNFNRKCFKVQKVSSNDVPENLVNKMRLYKEIESLTSGSIFGYNDYVEIVQLSKDELFNVVYLACKHGLLEMVYKVDSIYTIVNGEKITNKWEREIPKKNTIETEKGQLKIDFNTILVSTRRK